MGRKWGKWVGKGLSGVILERKKKRFFCKIGSVLNIFCTFDFWAVSLLSNLVEKSANDTAEDRSHYALSGAHCTFGVRVSPATCNPTHLSGVFHSASAFATSSHQIPVCIVYFDAHKNFFCMNVQCWLPLTTLLPQYKKSYHVACVCLTEERNSKGHQKNVFFSFLE